MSQLKADKYLKSLIPENQLFLRVNKEQKITKIPYFFGLKTVSFNYFCMDRPINNRLNFISNTNRI